MNNRYNKRSFYNKNELIDRKNRIITFLIVIIIILLLFLNSQRETINDLEAENISSIHEIKKMHNKSIELNSKKVEKPKVIETPKKENNVFKSKPKEKEKPKEKLDTISIIKTITTSDSINNN
jgi:predicted Holliday junction resolvase-like endonuclease